MFDGYCSTVKEGRVRKAHLLAYDDKDGDISVVLEYSEEDTEEISPATLLRRMVEGRLWNITL